MRTIDKLRKNFVSMQKTSELECFTLRKTMSISITNVTSSRKGCSVNYFENNT